MKFLSIPYDKKGGILHRSQPTVSDAMIGISNDFLSNVLHCTALISAKSCEGAEFTATGFFYTSATKGLLLVTNAHVLEGVEKMNITLTPKNEMGFPDFGYKEEVVVDCSAENIFFHPDWKKDKGRSVDLAAVRINEPLGLKFYISSTSKDFILQESEKEFVGCIEDVLMLGYPRGLIDVENNLPIVRRGITATSIHVDYCGVPSFLIDAACFPGSSGSPVFVIVPPLRVDATRMSINTQGTVKLVGVLSQWIPDVSEYRGNVYILPDPPPVPVAGGHDARSEMCVRVGIPLNLGKAVKAKEIIELEKQAAHDGRKVSWSL